jgi:oxalate decarboxylase
LRKTRPSALVEYGPEDAPEVDVSIKSEAGHQSYGINFTSYNACTWRRWWNCRRHRRAQRCDVRKPRPAAGGAINANPGGLSDPGPKNPALDSQFPSFESPPATDAGNMQLFWSSFNNAPKRIQNGGWARQVTVDSFPISTSVAGVNMRLGPGGIREMHWHRAAEWAIMTDGRCRITVLDPQGRAYVQDVGANDLWYVPAGYPHSLQGLGPDGAEFVLVFDNGHQSEYSTLLVTGWLAHTEPDLLAANFGVPEEVFKNFPLTDLWIFQGEEPGSLSDDQEAVSSGGLPPQPFSYRSVLPIPSRTPSRATSSLRTARLLKYRRRSQRHSRPSNPGRCARCTGIPTPMNGSTGSRARAA